MVEFVNYASSSISHCHSVILSLRHIIQIRSSAWKLTLWRCRFNIKLSKWSSKVTEGPIMKLLCLKNLFFFKYLLTDRITKCYVCSHNKEVNFLLYEVWPQRSFKVTFKDFTKRFRDQKRNTMKSSDLKITLTFYGQRFYGQLFSC